MASVKPTQVPDDVLTQIFTATASKPSDVLKKWLETPEVERHRQARQLGAVELLKIITDDNVIRWRVLDMLGLRRSTYQQLQAAGKLPNAPGSSVELLAGDLELWVQEVIPYAHAPAHWIYDTEDSPAPSAHHHFRVNIPGWDTPVNLTYTVAVTKGRPYRHLQVHFRYPAGITQGELNDMISVGGDLLGEWFSSIIRTFFPLHTATYRKIQAHTPIRVIEPVGDGRGGQRQVHKTPIVCRAWVRHDVSPADAAREVERDIRNKHSRVIIPEMFSR